MTPTNGLLLRRALEADELKRIYRALARAVDGLTFAPPVTHVYNPLDYAREPAERYLELAAPGVCSVLLMEASGRNRTPDKLRAAEREALFRLCDEALLEVVKVLRPRQVIGIGQFAEERARAALAGCGVEFGRILHPSPASPAANRGWAAQAERQLKQLGI